MKITKIIAGVAMMLVAGFCFGQQQRRQNSDQNTLLVTPLRNLAKSKVSDTDLEYYTDMLINALTRTKRFVVPDRRALELWVSETKFQMSDFASDDKTFQLGRALGANFLVMWSVYDIDGILQFTARIVDDTATPVGTAELELRSKREATTSKMDDFAKQLISDVKTAKSLRQDQAATEEQQAAAAERRRQSASLEAYRKEYGWKEKWFYLGGMLGGGMFFYGESSGYTTSPNKPFFGGFAQAEVWPFGFLGIEVDLGYGVGEVGSMLVPLLVKLGGHPGQTELSFNLGYTIGLGFTVGGTLGFHLGPGILSVELLVIPPFSDSNLILGGFAGYKVGLLDK